MLLLLLGLVVVGGWFLCLDLVLVGFSFVGCIVWILLLLICVDLVVVLLLSGMDCAAGYCGFGVNLWGVGGRFRVL